METIKTKRLEISEAFTEGDKVAIAVFKGLSPSDMERRYPVVDTEVGL